MGDTGRVSPSRSSQGPVSLIAHPFADDGQVNDVGALLFRLGLEHAPGRGLRKGHMDIDPVAQAELIKEAARIDSTTGRLPENETDPTCDHCGEHNWSTWLIFSGGYDRSRRLCEDCARQVLEWI